MRELRETLTLLRQVTGPYRMADGCLLESPYGAG